MKNRFIYHLPFTIIPIYLLLFLSLSCEREDFPAETVEAISREVLPLNSHVEFNFDDFQACFDEIAEGLNGPIFEERFGNDSEVRIQYEYKGRFSSVIPLITANEISSLIWMNSANDSYIISSSSYLPGEEREGTNISPGCVRLFNLTSDEINDLNEKEIQRELGAGFTVTRSTNNIFIRESENVIILENGLEEDDVIRPLCDYNELIDFYMMYFGLNDEDGNNTGQYEFDLQIFIDAVTSAVPNDGTCYCIKPCEVSNELGSMPGIGPYSMNLLNQHLIANVADLPEDFPIDKIPSVNIDEISASLCGDPNPDPSAWPIGIGEEDNAPDPIENGISLCDIEGQEEPCSGLDVGGSESRGTTADLCHGLNDTDAVEGLWFSNTNPQTSVEQLCAWINELFAISTSTAQLDPSNVLRQVAFDFMAIFKNNTDENRVESDIRLSEAVANDVNMQNYMKAFGAEVSNHLELNCGDITGLNINFEINEDPNAEFEQVRPFLGPGNTFSGLRIIVNDTEATQISLIPNTYNYNPVTKEWQASFCFTVCDHYGLDRAEVLNWQFYPVVGQGFAAWYHLQKIHNSVPFETKMYMSATLKGKLEC